MLSIIIPTYNEASNHFFIRTLKQLQDFDSKQVEVIVVDSNSTDRTRVLINDFCVKYCVEQGVNRADRLNRGVAEAAAEVLLLHHPRSMIDKSTLQEFVQSHTNFTGWGGFTHCFDESHAFLRFVSWYSNSIRVLKKGIIYLDHCFVLSQELAKKIFPIPSLDIFEDTEISKRLLQHSKPVLLPGLVTTSAIRFRTNGIYKQWLINQTVKFLYHQGVSHQRINQFYEKNCLLNMEARSPEI